MNRALLLLLAISACDRLPFRADPHATHAGDAAAEANPVAFYTCPMHPTIKQPGPGKCPLCGMDLTPVTKAELETGAIRVDATRRERFGIEVAPAEVRVLATTLRAPAVVTWDPDRIRDVPVRVSGFVEDLVAGAPGEKVRAGQTLFTVYSPDLVATQEDLLRAAAQADAGAPGAAERRDAARRRLVRWGLTDAQVDGILQAQKPLERVPVLSPIGGWVLDRTVVAGSVVSPGQTVFRVGDLREVWLEAAVPEGRLDALAVGQTVTVRLAGEARTGKVAALLPEVDPTTRTARARVTLDNADGRLRPDQWASVEIALGGGEHLAVPESAVVYTGPRRVVFVDEGGDVLMPREVVTGIEADGWVEVREGLKAGEHVVVAGNFLVAADSRLKQGGEAKGGGAKGEGEHAGHGK